MVDPLWFSHMLESIGDEDADEDADADPWNIVHARIIFLHYVLI